MIYNFLHIAKCGGTTFKSALARGPWDQVHFITGEKSHQYDAQILAAAQRLNQADSLKSHLVMGHQAYGFHTLVSAEVRYITLLRNPVKRVYSYYQHAKALGVQRGYSAPTLQEYLDRPNNWQCNNGITRILSAQKAQMANLAQRELSVKDLEVAWKNLQNFYFFDKIENFEKALYRLNKKRKAPFKAYFYLPKNVRKTVLSITEVDENLIKSRNTWDLKLYEKASHALDKHQQPQNEFEQKLIQAINKNLALFARPLQKIIRR